MTTDSREAFEKWHDKLFDTSARECREAYGYPNNTAIQARYQVWQARQPEIDALKAALDSQRVIIEHNDRVIEGLRIDALKAALEPKYTEAELVSKISESTGLYRTPRTTIRTLIEMGVLTVREDKPHDQ